MNNIELRQCQIDFMNNKYLSHHSSGWPFYEYTCDEMDLHILSSAGDEIHTEKFKNDLIKGITDGCKNFKCKKVKQ